MINNDRIITYKNFIRVTIHHGGDVNEEMELIFFFLFFFVFFVSNESLTKECFMCYIRVKIGSKKVKVKISNIFKIFHTW